MATIRMLQFGTSSPADKNRYEELRDGRILIPTEASVDKLRTTLPDLDWLWIDDFGYLGWTISYIDGAVIWGRQWIITAPLIRGGEVCDLQSVCCVPCPLARFVLRMRRRSHCLIQPMLGWLAEQPPPPMYARSPS